MVYDWWWKSKYYQKEIIEMKKILFISFNHDLKRGSYRIWINDLNHYFNENGITSSIFKDKEIVDDYDILILDKADADKTEILKQKYPNKKIGVINLGCGSNHHPDFVIVGSIEEKNSLEGEHGNVFIYPLIEKQFQIDKIKEHTEREKLIICYHGNQFHLNRFNQGLSNALDIFDTQQPIILNIITDTLHPNWRIEKPNVKINYVQYDINTIKDYIMKADIGIVPNLENQPIEKVNESVGLYSSDYNIRFKNKSNSGRCFVFHQIGVPVIADITPSNLHILGNPENGFAVNGLSGWLKALMKLKDHNIRNKIAINAKQEFDRLYDPIKWAKMLYTNMELL